MNLIFRKKTLVFIFALSLQPILLMQANFAQDQPPFSKLEKLEKSMAANLTWNLQNALLLYYPEDKFVVKAKVELQQNKPAHELPRLPEALLNKNISRLPGLPYIPDDLQDKKASSAPANNLRNQVQKQQISLRRTRVNVLVDQNFSENDLRFIRRLVSLTADLDARRGDQIRVERMPFPMNPSAFAKEAKTSQPLAGQLSENKKPVSLKAEFDWRPYYFMAGVAALLLIFFLWGLRSILSYFRPFFSSPVSRDSSEKQNGRENQAVGSSNVIEKEKAQQMAERNRLKSEVIEAIVGTPASAAQVLMNWIRHHGESGMQDAAIVLVATSKSLLDLVAPYLGPEYAGNLQLQMDQLQPEDIEQQQDQVLKQFDEDLRRLALRARKEGEEADALAFLYKMSDEQLLHLIKPLKKGVKAIVLAQLRPERAAKILRTLDPENQKAVLAAVGNINQIPADVYQHIARQLSLRARELEKMRYVRANGVDSLIEVLEQLDEKTQEDILQFLQTQDIHLAEKVRSRFWTFHDLLTLPGEQLRELAVKVDREMLAKSLVTVDAPEVERIIQALPDRLGEMVRASLETMRHVPESEVKQARREVLRKLKSDEVGANIHP